MHDEYEWLLNKFGLEAVPLEFRHTPEADFPMYGGTPRRIVISFSDNDLSVIYEKAVTATAGPPTWEEKSYEGEAFWKRWRSDLWHEVVHQAQDQKGFDWDPNDGRHGHARGWQSSIEWAAAQLGCTDPKVLYELLASRDTPLFTMAP